MSEERRPDIYQANPLIEGRQPFNAIEMRLFLLALQHVNPHLSAHDRFYDHEFEELHLTPMQTKEIFGHGEYLRRLEKICDGMMSKFVTIRKEDGGFSKLSIFGRIEYKPKDGLHILLDEQMRPLVLELFESGFGYTKIAAKQLFCLSSAYAVRLLEIMLQYKGMMRANVITRHIEIVDLRTMLGIRAEQYPRIFDFRKHVLDIPIKDINTATQYVMSYAVTKTSRRITGVDFTLDCREVMTEAEAAENVKLEVLPKRADRHGLSEKAVTELTTICGSNEEFKKRMDYALKVAAKRKPANVQGFLYQAIKENYLQQELDAQAAIEREIQAAQDRAEWEQFAKKIFNDQIAVDENKPEIPFNQNDNIDAAIVRIIKKNLKDGKLDFTVRSRLEEHNMSVGRFLELYCCD